MSIADSHQALFELYDKYVGEAESRREVYAYWTFIAGYVFGITGVLLFIGNPLAQTSTTFYQIREVAIVLASFGLMLSLLGIVLQLPLRQLGIRAALGGAVIGLSGIGYFVSVYPQDWLGQANRTVIAVYLLGVGLIAGVASLVPVLTGERSFLLENGLEDEEHDILVGEALRGGLFAVYRRNPAEWAWRLVEQEAVADGVRQFASRPDAEASLDDIRSKVIEAGMMEIRHAAFRLYESDGRWRWLLMEEDGSAAASSPGSFANREFAEESVSALKEYGPDAELVDIDGAAFDLRREGTTWNWVLVDEQRDVMAESPDNYRDPESAVDSLQELRTHAEGAGLLTIDTLGFEVRDDEGGWRWHLVDHQDTELASGTTQFDSGQAVREAVDSLRGHAGSASVLDATTAGFEVVEDANAGLTWRLVDSNDEIVARSHAPASTVDDADGAIDRLQRTVADADVLEREDRTFEVYPTDGGWHWRLVGAERDVVAESTSPLPSQEAAEESVEHVVTQTGMAELIQFEQAAFQLYEADEGGWRWRLIDEGGSVMDDTGEDYDSRAAAASSLTVLKENAPNADLLEIESAAFELHTDDAGEWAWRLVDEQGATIARGNETHGSKTDAIDATETMREFVPDATTHAINGAAFQVYERTGETSGWHWQFVHADGDILTDSVTAQTTRDSVARAIDAVKTAAVNAATHHVDQVAFQLYTADNEWGWRLVTADREVLGDSSRRYEAKTDAVEAVQSVREHVARAGVFELEDVVFRAREADDETWRWELVDEERTVLARSPHGYGSRDGAESAIDRVRTLGADAPLLEFDDAAFELVEDEQGWGWRLIDEDNETLAVGASSYETAEEVREALESMKSGVADASIIEIDAAAFELHEHDDGWTWSLVDEQGNTVAESTATYPTRAAARDGMHSLKEYAPEAALVTAG